MINLIFRLVSGTSSQRYSSQFDTEIHFWQSNSRMDESSDMFEIQVADLITKIGSSARLMLYLVLSLVCSEFISLENCSCPGIDMKVRKQVTCKPHQGH